MATQDRRASRGRTRGRRLLAELLAEVETARVSRGLSHATLGRAIGLSGSQVGRFLRAETDEISLPRLSALLAVVGLDFSARAYPGGPAIRDRAQLALLERFRVRLHPSLRWRTEAPVVGVPTSTTVDQRAWDAAVDSAGWALRVEAETRLHDVQALQRRIALKQRDSGAGVIAVLLVSDTRANSAAIHLANAAVMSQFPVSGRLAMQRLSRGETPGGNALVVL